MFCHKCGFESSEDMSFCAKCGIVLLPLDTDKLENTNIEILPDKNLIAKKNYYLWCNIKSLIAMFIAFGFVSLTEILGEHKPTSYNQEFASKLSINIKVVEEFEVILLSYFMYSFYAGHRALWFILNKIPLVSKVIKILSKASLISKWLFFIVFALLLLVFPFYAITSFKVGVFVAIPQFIYYVYMFFKYYKKVRIPEAA